jgi:ribosomal protein S18 acetylase RimI-like enzyme
MKTNWSIVCFENKYLDDMAQLFVKEYSEKDAEWNKKTAKRYLLNDTETSPDYCYAAIDKNNKCIGAIFCRLDPYYKGNLLFIDSLQVYSNFRKQGIATALLKKVKRICKKNKIIGIHLLADNTKDFPKEWYKKLGFEKTDWVEFEVSMKNIKI